MNKPLSVPHFRSSLLEPPFLSSYAAFVSPHQVLEWHQPVDKWQLLLVSHSGVCSCDGRVVPYGPRTAFVFPPRSRCRLERSGQKGYEHIFVWFVPTVTSDDFVALPLMTDISRFFDTWLLQWTRALDRVQFARTGVVAWVWGILWHLSSGPENVRTNYHVEEAEKIIQERLSGKIGVLDLAKELDISHSQLVRLFRSEHGTTIQEYIRMQRTVQACRLLTTTTSAIKTIAAQVGVPDLQQFSRMIRTATGVSPRQMRQERKTFDAHMVTEARAGTREPV